MLFISLLILPFAGFCQVYFPGIPSGTAYWADETIINMPYKPPTPLTSMDGMLYSVGMNFTDSFTETDSTKVSYNRNPNGMRLHMFYPKVIPGRLATQEPRPLIVFGYGCGFALPWTDAEAAGIPRWLAEQGYVVVAPEYRIGINMTNEELSKRAIWRGVQDIRKVITYSRKLSNPSYCVDTTMPVTYIGYSSGALIGLHNLYLNETNRPASTKANYEIVRKGWFKKASEIKKTYDLGTLDAPFLGAGGWDSVPSYITSKNLGIQDITISISGAIGDINWIINNNVQPIPKALYLIHHAQDGVVPYGNGYAFGNFALFKVSGKWKLGAASGSKVINDAYNAFPLKKPPLYQFSTMREDCPSGDTTCLLGNAGGSTKYGVPTWYHDPAENGNNTVVMDSILSFIKKATCEIAFTCSNGRMSATKPRPFTTKNTKAVTVYPNPVTGHSLTVTAVPNGTPYRILDMLGKELRKGKISSGRITVEGLSSGTYLLELMYNNAPVVKLFNKQ